MKLSDGEAGAELLERKMVCGGVNSLGAVRKSLRRRSGTFVAFIGPNVVTISN